LDYQEIIDRRRALIIEPFKSLAEVGFDGPWVTPYQISSKSFEGPLLVGKTLRRQRQPTIRGYGELWRGSSDWIGRPSRSPVG